MDTTPDFKPDVLASIIAECLETKWRPSTEVRRVIYPEVARFFRAAGIELNLDDAVDMDFLAATCSIYTQGMEVGYQYARAESADLLQ